MSYNPRAITEDDRSYSYKALWAGLPLSLLLLASMQFEALSQLSVLAGGFVSGIFIAQIWNWSYDEFAQREIAFASGWALSFAGLVLFGSIVPFMREYEPDTGLVLAIMATIFHTAIYVHRIRNGAFAKDEA